jgi:hypothetical protein
MYVFLFIPKFDGSPLGLLTHNLRDLKGGSMSKLLIASTFALFLAAFLLAHAVTPAYAANVGCVATPSSGPVGTTFSLTASGFDPNTTLWLYATEPDGTAFSDPEFNAFGGGVKTSASGTANFSFGSRFVVQGFTINRALGDWTLVAQELGLGGSVVHEAHCTVTLTSGGEQALGGATLQVNPYEITVGTNGIVTGWGFAPNETVNLWVSPPPGCSSFAFASLDVLYQYSGASAFTQDNVKANTAGQIAYTLPTYSVFTCQGEWSISAYQPSSGIGAIAEFEIAGRAVPGGAYLFVDKSSGYSRGDTFTFSGFGFTASGVATCWLTRPEGTVRPIGSFKTNGAGVFSFTFTTGFDFEGDFDGDGIVEQMHYSEGSLGTYAMTCRDNASGATGETTFVLNGLLSDP